MVIPERNGGCKSFIRRMHLLGYRFYIILKSDLRSAVNVSFSLNADLKGVLKKLAFYGISFLASFQISTTWQNCIFILHFACEDLSFFKRIMREKEKVLSSSLKISLHSRFLFKDLFFWIGRFICPILMKVKS